MLTLNHSREGGSLIYEGAITKIGGRYASLLKTSLALVFPPSWEWHELIVVIYETLIHINAMCDFGHVEIGGQSY